MAERKVPHWVQEALLPPNVSEITLKVMLMAEPEHIATEIEMRNPVDGELLDLTARPHFTHEHLGELLLEQIWLLEDMICRHYGTSSPFGRGATLRERLRALGVPPPMNADPFP